MLRKFNIRLLAQNRMLPSSEENIFSLFSISAENLRLKSNLLIYKGAQCQKKIK